MNECSNWDGPLYFALILWAAAMLTAWIVAIAVAATSNKKNVAGLPKAVWIVIMIVFNVVGVVAFMMVWTVQQFYQKRHPQAAQAAAAPPGYPSGRPLASGPQPTDPWAPPPSQAAPGAYRPDQASDEDRR